MHPKTKLIRVIPSNFVALGGIKRYLAMKTNSKNTDEASPM